MEQSCCFHNNLTACLDFGNETLENSVMDMFASSSSSFDSPSDDLDPFIHPVCSHLSIALPETCIDGSVAHAPPAVFSSLSNPTLAHTESQSTSSSLYVALSENQE